MAIEENVTSIIKVLVWTLIALTIVSTIFLVFGPLLPTAEEYIGSFPENLGENLETWMYKTFWRHLVLFHEYYSVVWILSFLSNVFFLILLLNVRQAINDYDPKKSEKLIDNYFNWTVGSLLIAIVFITKAITSENVDKISLGILGLTISIFVLLYYATRISKESEEEE